MSITYTARFTTAQGTKQLEYTTYKNVTALLAEFLKKHDVINSVDDIRLSSGKYNPEQKYISWGDVWAKIPALLAVRPDIQSLEIVKKTSDTSMTIAPMIIDGRQAPVPPFTVQKAAKKEANLNILDLI